MYPPKSLSFVPTGTLIGVNLLKIYSRFIEVDLMLAWMRTINISMESAFTPAPLWRLAWRMVVQMLPGRA